MSDEMVVALLLVTHFVAFVIGSTRLEPCDRCRDFDDMVSVTTEEIDALPEIER
jgi:hypothetical protein